MPWPGSAVGPDRQEIGTSRAEQASGNSQGNLAKLKENKKCLVTVACVVALAIIAASITVFMITRQSQGCSAKPCKNGKCVEQAGGFACICDDGFEGETCNKQTNAESLGVEAQVSHQTQTGPQAQVGQQQPDTTAAKTVQVAGGVHILNMDYSPELDDTSSAVYKNHSNFICEQLVDQIPSWTVGSDVDCIVTNFSKGSLVADYILTVKNIPRQTPSSVVIQSIALEIYNKLKTNNTPLKVNITNNAVIFNDGNHCDPNPCLSNNSMCIRIPFNYECACVGGLAMSIDGKCLNHPGSSIVEN